MAFPWTTAVTDLRTLLSDVPIDRLGYRKMVFGRLDGLNTVFKTFEVRRTTDFTTATAPEGVYVDGIQVGVTTDDTQTGEFNLASAPSDGQRIEATYYSQWYFDTELQVFLKNAMQWLGFGDDYTQIPDGLQPAALYYAAQEAMHKMAVRWMTRMSQMYQVSDAPTNELTNQINVLKELAKEYREKSNELRENFYQRNDQALAPLFGMVIGRVKEPTPPR